MRWSIHDDSTSNTSLSPISCHSLVTSFFVCLRDKMFKKMATVNNPNMGEERKYTTEVFKNAECPVSYKDRVL